MDFHDEATIGRHTFGVTAKSTSTDDDQPAGIALEFAGGDGDGTVVAEGNLLISVDSLPDAAEFLSRTLAGLAALHGKQAPSRRSRARPPRAGQPWTAAENELLKQVWLETSETSPDELLRHLAEQCGRSRAAVRAQLPRLGCDPDVPGGYWQLSNVSE